MLSNPWLMSSAGRSESDVHLQIQQGRGRNWRIRLRFSRWRAGLPGIRMNGRGSGLMPDSRAETNALVAAASGRGRPTGGIKPARSFRITFSSCSE